MWGRAQWAATKDGNDAPRAPFSLRAHHPLRGQAVPLCWVGGGGHRRPPVAFGPATGEGQRCPPAGQVLGGMASGAWQSKVSLGKTIPSYLAIVAHVGQRRSCHSLPRRPGLHDPVLGSNDLPQLPPLLSYIAVKQSKSFWSNRAYRGSRRVYMPHDASAYASPCRSFQCGFVCRVAVAAWKFDAPHSLCAPLAAS